MSKAGILLVNLGTPDSFKAKDVYRYLIEFLTDARVITSPWLIRQLIVRTLIVPFRYRESARSYQKIWTHEGSPLKVYGYKVKKSLQDILGEDYAVELAMRYRQPSIKDGLEALKQAGVRKILVFPLFPQYASATTGSVHQKIMEIVSRYSLIPEITFAGQYPTHPELIAVFCSLAAAADYNSYEHVLFSFHGLPKSHIVQADCNQFCFRTDDCCRSFCRDNEGCYSAQCYATAKAIAQGLKLPKQKYSTAFQSRLGRDPWLDPYTGEVITTLAKRGIKRVLVLSPSFTCDCLETIYEIGVEYAYEFKRAGGEVLDLVPAPNDHPQWIQALSCIIKQKMPLH